jgi:DNA mismatch repair protein MutL
MRIIKLDEITASKIAAGEVVERPANIIKETIENSIDAKASNIKIYLDNNLQDITIVDDGSGIQKEDLHLSITQHATSKLSKFEDLHTHSKFGFRGEALASISSVTKFKITSRIKDDEAYSLSNFGSYKNVVMPDKLSVGTKIEIKDLFYNIPVRKKYLKTYKTELSQIQQILLGLMIINSKVSFTIYNQGKIWFDVFPAHNQSQIKARIAKLLGEKFINHCFYIEKNTNEYKIHGWVTTPEYIRRNNDQQFFAVNNRLVKDKTILHAIKNAFVHNYEFSAGYILFLDVPSDKLDINVHPMKMELRFLENRYVHDFILSALKNNDFQLNNAYPEYNHIPNIQNENHTPKKVTQTKAKLLINSDEYALIQEEETFIVADVSRLKMSYVSSSMKKTNNPQSYLLPINIYFNKEITQDYKTQLMQLGFVVQQLENSLVIRGASLLEYKIANQIFAGIQKIKPKDFKNFLINQSINAKVEITSIYNAHKLNNFENMFSNKIIYKSIIPKDLRDLL